MAGGQVSPAGWTHVVYVLRGAEHTLYVNGNVVGSRTLPLRSAPVTAFMLGGYADADGQLGDREELWRGRLDEVRVYGRALSANEVRALTAGAR